MVESISGIKSQIVATVFVARGDVVAAVAGSADRTVPIDKALLLDGNDSYDQD